MIGLVDAFEEGKNLRVGNFGRFKRTDILYGDVSVPNDYVSLNLLGSAEVVLLGVDEVSGSQVLDVHPELEGLVGWESAAIWRVGDFRGGHIARGDDISNHDSVATAFNLLLTIGQSFSEAEVDAN